jgi:hypothetical protein
MGPKIRSAMHTCRDWVSRVGVAFVVRVDVVDFVTSSDFRKPMIPQMLLVMMRLLINLLMIRQPPVIDHRRLVLRQSTFIWCLVLHRWL